MNVPVLSDGATLATTPRLSVIVPVLNEEALIENTLLALQIFRTAGAELIVVDGGSTDSTMQRARPLADHTVKAVRGRAHQMNVGADLASSAVLLFLHADTRLPQTALDVVLNALTISNRAWGRFDVMIDGPEKMLKVIAFLMNWRSRLSGIATGDQAIFVWRSDFFEVDGFPQLALMEDIEMSRRLGQISPPICLSEKVVTSGRRWSKTGIWRTILLMWRLRLLYWFGVPAEKLAKQYR